MSPFKTLLTLVLALTLLSSCGVVQRVKNRVKTRQKVTVDSSATTETRTTREIDTLVSLPGDTAEASKDEAAIDAGDSLVIETPWTVTVVKKEAGRIKAKAILKPRTVAVKAKEETVTKAAVNVHRKEKRREVSVQKTTERKANPWGWVVLIACIAIIGFVAYLAVRKFL